MPLLRVNSLDRSITTGSTGAAAVGMPAGFGLTSSSRVCEGMAVKNCEPVVGPPSSVPSALASRSD